MASPKAPKNGLRPSFSVSTLPTPQDGYLKVCKDTPAGTTGTFQFDLHVHYPFPYKDDWDTSTQINDGECQTMFAVEGDPLMMFSENLAMSDPAWHLVTATVISDDNNGAQGPYVASEWTKNCQPDGTGCGLGQRAGSDVATATDPINCWVDPWHGCVIIVHNAPNPDSRSLTIGPSNMGGHLRIPAGSWFSGGYTFKFEDNTHGATQVTIASKLEVPVTCPNGGGPGGTITIRLGTKTYDVSAGNTDWLLTGHIHDILSWTSSARTPDLCGGFLMDNQSGAVFTATVLQSPATGSPIDFKFKYRDPAAKNKVDTNCYDPADPNRDKPNICSAGWSTTVVSS